MLNKAQLEKLKRTNISRNPEKTRQRVTELWQGLKIKQKQAIRELAGITAQPIYRTQETGNISARLAIAFAQSLGVSPAYLTGELDEPGECTAVTVRDLLLEYGYCDLAASIEIPTEKPQRKYEQCTRPEVAKTFVDEEVPAVPEVQLPPGSDALTTEDLQNLIFALHVQAKAGILGAKEKLDQIKLIMLT